MMGFFDKVKKALGSKKEDVEYQNDINDELTDESTFTESIGNDNGNFNDDKEIQSEDSEEIPANEEITDKPTPTEKIRNFKYLDDLIHSGAKEIILDSDIVLGDGEESDYKHGIKLDVDDLVIDGNGHSIDAQGKSRIFRCNGQNIIIKNLLLKNGFTNGKNYEFLNNYGGAIHNSGTLTILRSILNENMSEQDGGAIYNGGELTIIESTILGNTAEGNGGAIQNNGDKLTIMESSLTGNTAKDNGGVIRNNGDEITIIKSTLTGNTAECNGGAIYNKGARYVYRLSEEVIFGGKLTIEDSTFAENSSQKDGGAIYNDYDEVTIRVTAMVNNTARVGGAIYNEEGMLTISESNFTKNWVEENGKDIFNGGRIFTGENISPQLEIHNDCGAVFPINSKDGNFKDFTYLDQLIRSGSNEIKLEHDIILNISRNENKTFKNGINVVGSDLTIDGNGRTIDAQGHTRIFNCSGKNITIKNITLKNGFSVHDNGVIYNSGELNALNCVLSGNYVLKDAGVINNLGVLMVKNSFFSDNTTRNGEIICNCGWGNISDCNFSNNASNIIVGNDDYLEIHNTIFKDNQSEYILINKVNGSMGIFYGECEDNDIGGSLIYNIGNFLTISNHEFKDNVLRSKELKSIHNKSNLTLINPLIKDSNFILNDGHIIVKNASNDFLSKIRGEGGVDFEENRVPSGKKFDFGYLDMKIHETKMNEIVLDEDIFLEKYEIDFYEGGIELDMDDLVIDGNGHTIDARHNSRFFIITGRNITLKNIKFKNGGLYRNFYNCLNNDGGGLRINSKSTVVLEHCEFIDNFSKENGGVINNKGKLNIIDSKLSDNHAENEGGTIYNLGELCVVNSNFSGNVAEKYGGAISNYGKLSVKDSILCSNHGKSGGVIYNESDSDLKIIGSELKYNYIKGYFGGAICSYGKLILENSIFSHNFATHDEESKGSAIFVSGYLFIIGSSFLDNGVEFAGGAIYISNLPYAVTNASIVQSKFLNNSSKINGGAICNEGVLSINNSVLSKNSAYDYGGAIEK